MAWKAEVIADETGHWYGNGIVLATREEAEAYVLDLAIRWTAVRDTRTVETDAPVNYRYGPDGLRAA